MTHPISDELVGLTPAERAAHKAAAYGVIAAPDNLMAGSRIVSIIEGPTLVDGMVRVVLALWIDSGVGFELIDLGDANPFYIRNPPILVPDPGGDIVRTSEDPITHVVTSTWYREDLDQALMQIAYDACERFVGTGGEM